ncbi:apoptosis-enhancing nuclease-like [Megalops cyprinoides]|uniref:apoptosis-enhancing nuclease-like n=1 Tax=Megalops cyprinoides TaxID=118141 RepID=UPI0018650353|nr:apoptosis-enhancing nuclease-like [Megalops cyprinoides]
MPWHASPSTVREEATCRVSSKDRMTTENDSRGIGSGWKMLPNPRPLPCSSACQSDSLSHVSKNQRGGQECLSRKRTSSKLRRIERRRATLQKIRILKKRRRELCTKLRGQGDAESGIDSLHTEAGTLLAGQLRDVKLAKRCERWEVDSGFSSEVSPPTSGRSSPCGGIGPTRLVSMDCEMVGTGPEGRCSELARCSLVNYYGEVLYDKYIKPQHPVTDYRTRWSGICKRHLLHAVPFDQAKKEIIQILKEKVVVGHALHNDFRALGFLPPRHMIRDTSRMRLLRRLSKFPNRGSISLKNLARALLNRNIQMGMNGHSSVEDAMAAMDLYKLVEGQWEQDFLSQAEHLDTSTSESSSSSSHYMQDEYWPAELIEH